MADSDSPSNPSELFVRAHRHRLRDRVSNAFLALETAKLRGDVALVPALRRELVEAQAELTRWDLEYGEGDGLDVGAQPTRGKRWAA